MSRGSAIRSCVVIFAVVVLGVAAPASAAKGPKKQVGNRPASPGNSSSPGANADRSSEAANATPKPDKPDPARAKPGPKKPALGLKGKGHASRPVRGRDATGRRHERRAHTKPQRPTRAPALRPARSEGGKAGDTEVLGLRISLDDGERVVEVAGPALLPRPSGEALPFTGGDVAALLFVGLMVITIGGLIWRAPTLIDKPKRSRDHSPLP